MKTMKYDNTDMNALVEVLSSRNLRVSGRSAQCPWHEDKSPSASLLGGNGEAARVYCHVCQRHGDIYDITGSKPMAAESPRVQVPAKRELRHYADVGAILAAWKSREAAYQYENPDTGAVEALVIRYRKGDRKSFVPHSPTANDWVDEAPAKPWGLYNRKMARSAKDVIIVEGEKCVDALSAIGVASVTNMSGGENGRHSDWSPLAGKNVILWPDNDQPDPKTGKRKGIAHMRDVQAILERLTPAPSVWWIDPDTLNLPPKGDVADMLGELAGASDEVKLQAIAEVIRDAKPIGASQEVHSLLSLMVSGAHKPIEWPWPRISRASRSLMPGTVTLLCGEAGSTKSFLLLEAAASWHRDGVPVSIFELEEDRRYHLHRSLAQQAKESQLLDSQWCAANQGQVFSHHREHSNFLNSFGACIWEAPDKQVTLDELAEWVLERSKAGARVVAIDPVTAAACSDKPWIADQKFIMQVKTIVRDYGNSLILVTHPTKGPKGKTGTGQISGGAAYMRFSQSALWLATTDNKVNRELHIMKARNGRGQGMAIGMTFDGQTLCFTEQQATETTPRNGPDTRMADRPNDKNEDLFG